MTFTTVFDARTGLHANGWLPSLIMIPAALLIFARRSRLPLPAWASRVVSIVMLVAAFVVPALGFFSTYLQRKIVGDAFRDSRYAIAQGAVGHLLRTTRRGRVIGQSFMVGSHRFSYSCDDAAPPTFHDCGNLIQDGRYVRMTYAGDTILRVEVAR